MRDRKSSGPIDNNEKNFDYEKQIEDSRRDGNQINLKINILLFSI